MSSIRDCWFPDLFFFLSISSWVTIDSWTKGKAETSEVTHSCKDKWLPGELRGWLWTQWEQTRPVDFFLHKPRREKGSLLPSRLKTHLGQLNPSRTHSVSQLSIKIMPYSTLLKIPYFVQEHISKWCFFLPRLVRELPLVAYVSVHLREILTRTAL